jgi:hypothetical protein
LFKTWVGKEFAQKFGMAPSRDWPYKISSKLGVLGSQSAKTCSPCETV